MELGLQRILVHNWGLLLLLSGLHSRACLLKFLRMTVYTNMSLLYWMYFWVLLTQIFPTNELLPLSTSLPLPPHYQPLPLLGREFHKEFQEPVLCPPSQLKLGLLQPLCLHFWTSRYVVLCWPTHMLGWRDTTYWLSDRQQRPSNYLTVSVSGLCTMISNTHINLWNRHYSHFTVGECGGSGRSQRPSNSCTWWWGHTKLATTLSGSFYTVTKKVNAYQEMMISLAALFF